jgi:hypothetical protein
MGLDVGHQFAGVVHRHGAADREHQRTAPAHGNGSEMSPEKFAAFFRTQYDAFGSTVRQHNLKFEQ